MKYSIATTQDGCVETLEINGKEYRRKWISACDGIISKNKAFGEQLRDDGITDGTVLDKVAGAFGTLIPSEFVSISKILNR